MDAWWVNTEAAEGDDACLIGRTADHFALLRISRVIGDCRSHHNFEILLSSRVDLRGVRRIHRRPDVRKAHSYNPRALPQLLIALTEPLHDNSKRRRYNSSTILAALALKAIIGIT